MMMMVIKKEAVEEWSAYGSAGGEVLPLSPVCCVECSSFFTWFKFTKLLPIYLPLMRSKGECGTRNRVALVFMRCHCKINSLILPQTGYNWLKTRKSD